MDLIQKVQTNQWGSSPSIAMALLIVGMAAVVAFMFSSSAARARIPIQSARVSLAGA